MSGRPKKFAPWEKISILSRHLDDNITVTEVCEENGVDPEEFHNWLKLYLNHGEEAFESNFAEGNVSEAEGAQVIDEDNFSVTDGDRDENKSEDEEFSSDYYNVGSDEGRIGEESNNGKSQNIEGEKTTSDDSASDHRDKDNSGYGRRKEEKLNKDGSKRKDQDFGSANIHQSDEYPVKKYKDPPPEWLIFKSNKKVDIKDPPDFREAAQNWKPDNPLAYIKYMPPRILLYFLVGLPIIVFFIMLLALDGLYDSFKSFSTAPWPHTFSVADYMGAVTILFGALVTFLNRKGLRKELTVFSLIICAGSLTVFFINLLNHGYLPAGLLQAGFFMAMQFQLARLLPLWEKYFFPNYARLIAGAVAISLVLPLTIPLASQYCIGKSREKARVLVDGYLDNKNEIISSKSLLVNYAALNFFDRSAIRPIQINSKAGRELISPTPKDFEKSWEKILGEVTEGGASASREYAVDTTQWKDLRPADEYIDSINIFRFIVLISYWQYGNELPAITDKIMKPITEMENNPIQLDRLVRIAESIRDIYTPPIGWEKVFSKTRKRLFKGELFQTENGAITLTTPDLYVNSRHNSSLDRFCQGFTNPEYQVKGWICPIWKCPYPKKPTLLNGKGKKDSTTEMAEADGEGTGSQLSIIIAIIDYGQGSDRLDRYAYVVMSSDDQSILVKANKEMYDNLVGSPQCNQLRDEFQCKAHPRSSSGIIGNFKIYRAPSKKKIKIMEIHFDSDHK